MREEFEKLPAIKRAMKDGSVEWDDGDGCYGGDDDYCSGYVNGAWFAYQEQQKKIDGVLDIACKHQYSNGERIYNEIKELLK